MEFHFYIPIHLQSWTGTLETVGKGKGHPCTGTEALYRPYGPKGE